ncbi:MAG: hypothetical protein VX107_16235, partial [Pseudomonadota bacterium]|nr:hypothetical protein [Pseudomonadota bacterium]
FPTMGKYVFAVAVLIRSVSRKNEEPVSPALGFDLVRWRSQKAVVDDREPYWMSGLQPSPRPDWLTENAVLRSYETQKTTAE